MLNGYTFIGYYNSADRKQRELVEGIKERNKHTPFIVFHDIQTERGRMLYKRNYSGRPLPIFKYEIQELTKLQHPDWEKEYGVSIK